MAQQTISRAYAEAWSGWNRTADMDTARVWRCRFPRIGGGGFLYVVVKAANKWQAWEVGQVHLRSNRDLVSIPAKPHVTRLKSREDR